MINFKIEYFFKTVNLPKLFCLLALSKLLITGLLSFVVTSIDERLLSNPIDESSSYVVFFVSVLFAPFIETLIFQSLIFSVARKFNLKDSLIILLSTMLFASIHYYNLAYFLVMIFSGFFYSYTFSQISNRENNFTAFLFVSSIHAANNLVAFLVDFSK